MIEYYSHDAADKLRWTNTNSNQEPNDGQNKKYTRFEYDGFGQMSRRDRRATNGGTRKVLHFNWDTQGRVREVKEGSNTKFSALYAADGERVSKTDDTTGSHLFSFGLHDTGDGGTLYTPGLSQRRGTTDRFFHSDWLGSTRYLTDSTGTTTPTALRFNAFGKTTAQAGPDNPTPFGFAGAWGYETEGQNHLELQYLYQRYYDPQVGRFISRDPIRWAGGVNLYRYTRNDPINRVDPFGLSDEAEWADVRAAQRFQASKMRRYRGAVKQGAGILGWVLEMVASANPITNAGVAYDKAKSGDLLGAAITAVPGAKLLKGGKGLLMAVVPRACSKKLAANLIVAGYSRPAMTAAHHIVAGNDKRAAGARAILGRFGIGINDADNGMFLPNRKASTAPGAYHPSLHTNKYYEEVERRLRFASSRLAFSGKSKSSWN